MGFDHKEIIDFRSNGRILGNQRNILKYWRLATTTLGCNIIHILWNLLKIFTPASLSPKPQKILILGFGGIGNHLMLTPAIKNIKRTFPENSL